MRAAPPVPSPQLAVGGISNMRGIDGAEKIPVFSGSKFLFGFGK
jgi:hypothetical protein